jgi:cytochrome c oxidase assembly protein subunit 15
MSSSRLLRNLSLITLVAIYLVILAGSVVRMTGSGMGCPDWPKCFGQWIPPTDVSELPADYETHYLELRKKKLNRFISLLDAVGYPEIARQLSEDPSMLETESFDTTGTWIEYVNRLFGFLSGNFMLALFIVSLWWLKQRPLIPLLVFISLIAIVFQAWLGSVVVATNLTPWVITVHMIVAFLIIGLLIGVHQRVSRADAPVMHYKGVLLIAILLTLVQVVLGTQVRQEIDQIARSLAERSEWISLLSDRFEIHRSFSILILLVNGFFVYQNRQQIKRSIPLRFFIGFLTTEILLGIILSYLSMPKLAQPLHLLVATLFFGAQCWIALAPKDSDRFKRA